MMNLLPWLLQTSLFALLFQPIVCPNSDTFSTYRRDRASHMDSNENLSDSLSNLMDKISSDEQTIKSSHASDHKLHQHQYLTESNDQSPSNSHINDTIRSIFHLRPDKGLILFNNTYSTHLTSNDQMQADDAFRVSSPNDQQAFKVQRSPDGKLNLVFNDLLFLQRPIEGQIKPLKNSGVIIFPDDNVCLDGRGRMNDRSYCSEVKNYPSQDELDSIIKREFSNLEFFYNEDLVLPQNISQRMNNEPEEDYLCGSRETVVYPKGAVTKDDTWMWILNNNDTFKQAVRVEECITPGETCKYVQFPNHYTATCKQNYIYRSLWAVTENKTVVKDHFKMPSCCQCVVRQGGT